MVHKKNKCEGSSFDDFLKEEGIFVEIDKNAMKAVAARIFERVYQYDIHIRRAGNNYDAHAPSVPGCITTGGTIDDTITNMREALEFHIESMIKDGEKVPKLKSGESGKVTINE